MTNKKMKNYLLTTAAMVLFAVASCFTGGILQLVMGILISVLLGSQTAKYHYGYVFASASLVFLIPIVFAAVLSGEASFADAVIFGALLMVPVILMGLTLGFAANLKLSFYKTVLILTVLYLAGALTNMKVLSAASPAAFDMENVIASAVEQIQAGLDNAYAGNPEVQELFRAILGEIAKTMLTISPAIFALLSLLTAYVCAVLFKAFRMRQQADMSFWPAFYRLRADKLSGILFIVVFLLNAVAPEGLFSDASLNVLIILSGAFFLFGLAFIDWRLRASGLKAAPRRLILIACIPLCTMFFMMPLIVVITLGVTDGIFDFRTRTLKKFHGEE